MKTKYPIFIPSKGRAHQCMTARCLKKKDIEFFIVVEPQDEDDYRVHFDQLLVLDQNDQGLVYVRNWIKRYARSQGHQFHWQMDDDILRFQQRIDQKNVTVHPFEMFKIIEDHVDQYQNITISGLRDTVFGWSQKNEISYNKINSSVCLFYSMDDLTWNPGIIEDYDYSIRNLFQGNCSSIFNRFLYCKKPDNSAKGGVQLTHCYDDLNKNLVNQYPEFMRLKYDQKKNSYKASSASVWKLFTQKPILKNQKLNLIESYFETV